MKHKNNKNGVIVLLVVIIAILAVLCILFATGTINLKSNDISNNQISGNNDTKDKNDSNTNNKEQGISSCNCTSYVSQNYGCGVNNVDFSKLSEISKGDYNYIKGVYNNTYSLNVLSDGKVIINFNNYISNISNAKDIILFGDSPETVYILTIDGNVFKYELSNIKNSNFEAIKLTNYNNIKNMTTYMTRKKNAGGCNYLVLIDNEDKYYKLDSVCH